MRPLPHFPPEIPDEPLCLRRIYLPPNSGPRKDELVPLDWHGKAVTMHAADAFLREELTRSGAHGVRIETADGGFIHEHTVWDVVRERLGIEICRVGQRELAQLLLPQLPRL
jgi:hypothetical protein